MVGGGVVVVVTAGAVEVVGVELVVDGEPGWLVCGLVEVGADAGLDVGVVETTGEERLNGSRWLLELVTLLGLVLVVVAGPSLAVLVFDDEVLDDEVLDDEVLDDEVLRCAATESVERGARSAGDSSTNARAAGGAAASSFDGSAASSGSAGLVATIVPSSSGSLGDPSAREFPLAVAAGSTASRAI